MSIITIQGLKIIEEITVPAFGMVISNKRDVCTNDPKDFLPILPKPFTISGKIQNSKDEDQKKLVKKSYLKLGMYTNPNSSKIKSKNKKPPKLCVITPKDPE